MDIHYKTVYQTGRYKLKAKLKVARPTHLKRADLAVVEFKKTPDPAGINRCISRTGRGKAANKILESGRKSARFTPHYATVANPAWHQTGGP